MISKIEGFVENGDVKIHYVAHKHTSDRKTSILFVPGIMMPASIWDRQLAFFSQHYNVVAIEPRSQGDSTQATEGLHAENMARDIHAVVEQLDLSPLILVGWSIAVAQVVNYAARFAAERLVGLVLIDGIVGVDSNWPFYHTMVEYWSHFQEDRKMNTEKFVKEIFKQPQSDDFFEKLKEIASRTPTNSVMTLIYNYILQDFRPLLPKITVPTWIATTEGPRLEYMREMRSLIPEARLEIFPSAGHALFVDQSDLFNRSLQNFITGIT